MADDKNKPAKEESREEAGAKQSKPESQKHYHKKKQHKSVSFAKVYINCSFNNTIVTITDEKGNTICWATSGASGFKGTKKGTPFAAQITASKAANKAMEFGVKQAQVFVNGPGPGRETAIRAIASSGIHIVFLKDTTPLPHNGCRPPKARRV